MNKCTCIYLNIDTIHVTDSPAVEMSSTTPENITWYQNKNTVPEQNMVSAMLVLKKKQSTLFTYYLQ